VLINFVDQANALTNTLRRHLYYTLISVKTNNRMMMRDLFSYYVVLFSVPQYKYSD